MADPVPEPLHRPKTSRCHRAGAAPTYRTDHEPLRITKYDGTEGPPVWIRNVRAVSDYVVEMPYDHEGDIAHNGEAYYQIAVCRFCGQLYTRLVEPAAPAQ